MDARFLYIVVVLFTTFDTQVLAQNNSTTAAPTTTGAPAQSTTTAAPTTVPTTIVTPTQNMTTTAAAPSSNVTTLAPIVNGTMAPTAAPDSTGAPGSSPTKALSTSSTPTPSFDTKVKVMLQLDQKCSDVIKANLTTGVERLYSHNDYDFEDVVIKMDDKEKCTVNITVRFGKELKSTDIVKKFENATKSGAINTIKVTLLSIQAQVVGVELGKEYKPIDGACEAKCCGTGGPIEVKTTCTPEKECVNYKLTKTVKDCSTVCKCSAGAQLQMSLVILIFGFFVNWLLKE